MSQNNFGYFFKKKMFSRTFKNRPIWVHWLRSKKFCSIDRRTSTATDCLTSSSRRPRLAFVTFHTTAPFMSSSTTIGRERRHCHLLSMPTSRSSRQKRRHRDLRHSDGVWNQLSEFFWFLCWHCHTACHSTPPPTHTHTHPIHSARRWYTVAMLLYDLCSGLAIFDFKWEGENRSTSL